MVLKKIHEIPTTCGCTLEMAEDAPKIILGQNFWGLKNNPQSYGQKTMRGTTFIVAHAKNIVHVAASAVLAVLSAVAENITV